MNAPATLPVVRVEMAGLVTSFRYPHFAQGFQPTFEMPPPSTIYGHICSAVGNYLTSEALAALRFGYHFTHAGKFIDYQEHLHFDDPVQPFPFNRELLYHPVLTLYLTDLSLYAAFRSPHFPVVLGRSQDLMTYRKVEIVELVAAQTAYFEHTLLPLTMSPRLREPTITVTMPRYIDPRRRVQWGQYSLLQRRALWPQEAVRDDFDEADEGLSFEGDEIALWIDPTTPPDPKRPEAKRAVWLHSFVEVDEVGA